MKFLKITPKAKAEFVDYMTKHHKARRYETKCSGVDDIRDNIEAYFRIELREPEHHDVLMMIHRNGGTFTVWAMRRWIEENYHEIYVERKDLNKCD